MNKNGPIERVSNIQRNVRIHKKRIKYDKYAIDNNRKIWYKWSIN